MTSVCEIMFAIVCVLPRPDAPEPQDFQHGRSTNRAEIPAMFLPPLPITGPLIAMKPARKQPERHRESVSEPAPTVLAAYAPTRSTTTPDKGPGLLAKLFGVSKANAALPTVSGVDLSKPGYAAVYAAAKKHGVNVNLALRIAKQESRGRCSATSHAGARGVMQVMPGTGRRHGYSKSSLHNCKSGADAGVRELKRLQSASGGDLRKVLIGFNCGQGCWKRKKLPKETIDYIRIVGGGKL